MAASHAYYNLRTRLTFDPNSPEKDGGLSTETTPKNNSEYRGEKMTNKWEKLVVNNQNLLFLSILTLTLT